ncbi:ABC transporter substrate-binding protein [Actinocatenispora thailandica]|uniref:ABC transporter substrate-binding protein n=1 Tax=Actinocatenispora thailandica TaxID=227318 RepID=A0A7R7DMS8_9ACTN|nr:ABC transporter substrate-binding protein [Actinocatenispora thailandica]BCJ34436.1 ABC transporter substrate-binding protein [Actinocatenispora thailandica]
MRIKRSMARRAVAALGVLALAGSLAACGDSGGDSASGAKSDKLTGVGPITLATGKDTTGTLNEILAEWNKAHPKQKVTLTELPEDADQQRQQMVQNAQTKSDAYTILNLDVVWTSEFAANGWVEQLPESEFAMDKYLAPVVKTAKYFNKLYAAPYASDGALLYYRTDLLKQAGIAKAPTTWDEMNADCTKVLKLPAGKGMSCYGGQLDKYEGLTVNFSEAVDSAGGEVVGADGKPNVNTPEAKKGLDFLVDGVKDKTIPKDALTWKEEESRRGFESGKVVFLRNWPYCYSLMANKKDAGNKVSGKYGVAPIPGLSGPGKGTLGGHNLAISKFAKNKKTALDFIKWFTSEKNERTWLTKNSQAPVYGSLYDDPALQKQFPYLATLKQSIEKAEPRPAIVNYGDATAAIEEQAYAAISGSKSSAQALKDLQANLTKITSKDK